jgi:hypothetical protein
MPEGRTDEGGASELASPGPVFSYDVPQEVTYSGQHYIELRLAPTDFIATARSAGETKDGQ